MSATLPYLTTYSLELQPGIFWIILAWLAAGLFIGTLHMLLRHRVPENSPPLKNDSPPTRNAALGWTILSAVVLGVVYITTLLPGPGYSGDTGKFQFIGYVLGTPHEPGYPTYVLLNHFFQLLFPWGTFAYKANLLSAVCTVGASVVLHRLLLRLDVRPWIATIVVVTFGLGYAVWSQSVVAEVYALNLLFVSLVIRFFLRWHVERKDRFLYIACGFYAFSFGNHLTMITFLPAIIYLVWITDKTAFISPKKVLGILLIICAGAAQYWYLFWRTSDPSTAYVEMSAPDFSTFWFFVTGGQFKHLLFRFSLDWMLFDRLPQLQLYGLRELLLLAPFAVYGLTVIPFPKINSFFLLAIGCNVLFCMGYAILDIFAYLIPTYFVLALYAGIGIQALTSRLRGAGIVALTATLVLPVVAFVANYPYAARQNDKQSDQRTHAILQTVGHGALVVCPDYNYSHFLWYYVFVESYKDSQIYPVFYHEKEFPSKEIAGYLRENIPFPVLVTRRNVPIGLKVFLYVRSLEWEMDRLMMFKKLSDADVAKWRQMVVDTTRAKFRRLGVDMLERGEDLFELILSPPYRVMDGARDRNTMGGRASWKQGRPLQNGERILDRPGQPNDKSFVE
ncbi:MAG: DUF2723 domain-containing protein [Bacteroidota bacterium]